MTNQQKAELLKLLAIASELTASDLSDSAIEYTSSKLRNEPYDQVIKAIELIIDRGKRFTYGDILTAIRNFDGRPMPEEAWAMVSKGEYVTIAWTPEMQKAYAVASELMYDDKVQARMAFLETYKRELELARQQGIPVKWHISLGQDPHERADTLKEFAKQGLISIEEAKSKSAGALEDSHFVTDKALPYVPPQKPEGGEPIPDHIKQKMRELLNKNMEADNDN